MAPSTRNPTALEIDASRLSSDIRALEAKLVTYLMTPTTAGGKGMTLSQVAGHFHFPNARQRLYHISKMSPRSVSADLLHAMAWEQTFRELFNLSPEGRAYLHNISFDFPVNHLPQQTDSPPSVYYAEFHREKTAHYRNAMSEIDEIYQGLIGAAEDLQDEEKELRQLEQEQVEDHVQVNAQSHPQAKGDKGKAKVKVEVKAKLYSEQRQEDVKIQPEDVGKCLGKIWHNAVCWSEVERTGGYSKMDVARLIVGIREVADVAGRQDGTRFPVGFRSAAKE